MHKHFNIKIIFYSFTSSTVIEKIHTLVSLMLQQETIPNRFI